MRAFSLRARLPSLPPACRPPRCAPASASSRPPPPPPPDVAKLALMSRIDVTAEEAAAWTPQLEGIVTWFGALRDAEQLDGVPPMLTGEEEGAGVQRTREDVVRPFGAVEELMAACATREGPYIRVARILDEAV